MGTRRLVGLVVAACAAVGSVAPAADAATKRRAAGKARLAAVADCGDLLTASRARALAEPYLVPVSQARRPGDEVRGVPEAQPVMASPGAAADQEASETNVQEAGVDEPDTIKSAGGIVFAVSGGRLHAVDARQGRLAALGVVDLPPGEHELLLHGKRLLVLTQTSSFRALRSLVFAPQDQRVVLTEVDVSDPRALRVVRTLSTEGRLVGARRQGTTVRVVLTAAPTPIVLPAPAEGEPYASGAELERRRTDAIQAAGPSTFLPDAIVRDAATGAERHELLLGCQRLRRPLEHSGLDVLAVLTLDLDRGIEPVDRDAVQASGDDVYASDEGLYVTTTRWWSPQAAPDGGTVVTRVHRFAAGREPVTRYRASGTVRGSVLNQFAFSEHRGVLRVATTEQPVWGMGPAPERESESFVTVLDEREGALVAIGRVGGLGHGETIRGVRFLGDTAYVVTFRQTDPLYVVDLSDPRAPRVRGELKVLGYSAYLHPVGEDLLLGVGQDATAQGRRRGAQVSLFDVSDPTRPRRLDQVTFSPVSSTAVEWDHHAFLWWPRTRLAVLPLWEGNGFEGAVGLRASRAGGLRRVGAVRPLDGAYDAVQRSMVLGSRLLSLTTTGIVASRLEDLERLGALTLPGAPAPAPG